MSNAKPERKDSAPGIGSEVVLRSEVGSVGRPPLWTVGFVSVCAVSFLTVGSFQMLTPTLPLYLTTFGTTEFAIGLIMGMVPFTALLARPWVGWQLDNRGRRGIFLAGLGLYTVAVLCYALAPSVVWLSAARLAHGVAFGIVTTASATVVVDMVPQARRGEGIGYFALCTGLGQSVGPILGIALMEGFGVVPLFIASAAGPLLALLLALPIRYQALEANSGVGRLILIERKALPPSIVVMCLAFAISAPLTFIAIHAVRQGIGNIGLFFTAYTVAMLIARPFSGVLYDRHGLVRVVGPGMLLVATGMVILSVAPSLAVIMLAGLALGLGYGAAMPALQAAAVHGIPAQRRGAANGTVYAFIDAGFFLGPPVLGWVAEADSYPVMFLGAGVATVIGVVALGVVRPRRVTAPPDPSLVE